MRACRCLLVSLVATLMSVSPARTQEPAMAQSRETSGVDTGDALSPSRREAMRDSQLAEHRQRVEDAVRASRDRDAAQAKKLGPMSDRGPFHEYNWVFAANLFLGVLGGAFAVRTRRSQSGRDATVGWLAFGGCLGLAGAALIFTFCLFVVGIVSVLTSSLSPGALFAFTAPVIALASLGIAFDSGGRRFRRGWPR